LFEHVYSRPTPLLRAEAAALAAEEALEEAQ
jgi:hypothetical protein